MLGFRTASTTKQHTPQGSTTVTNTKDYLPQGDRP
ncbi:hypothetical protein AA0117_g11368 [Alternaria alternata]|uniref:Uncharacterized protein n=1 Tax=Alternaria alternata TaxID=5599 RepID=A0A4Q4N3P5_ALTAL|nr:hypothetical protein AA0117_g11368 [Alternaria alternata]